MEQSPNRFLRVEVGGDKKDLWKILEPKLINSLSSFFEIAPQNLSKTDASKKIRDTINAFSGKSVNSDILDNETKLAQIDLLVSIKEKEIAKARKLNAEAEEIELQNRIKELSLQLCLAKIIIDKSDDADSIIFIKQIEDFIDNVQKK